MAVEFDGLDCIIFLPANQFNHAEQHPDGGSLARPIPTKARMDFTATVVPFDRRKTVTRRPPGPRSGLVSPVVSRLLYLPS